MSTGPTCMCNATVPIAEAEVKFSELPQPTLLSDLHCSICVWSRLQKFCIEDQMASHVTKLGLQLQVCPDVFKKQGFHLGIYFFWLLIT